MALEQDIMLGGRTILPDSGLGRYHSIQGFPGLANDLVLHLVLTTYGWCLVGAVPHDSAGSKQERALVLTR